MNFSTRSWSRRAIQRIPATRSSEAAERTRRLLDAFRGPSDRLVIECDYSGIEMRILAHLQHFTKT